MSNNFKDYLEYKGGDLYWKKASTNRVFVGKKAGNLSVYGYIEVRINKKLLKAHRIIWEMFNGEIPDGKLIDHINGNRNDNRIENLRLVTFSQNCLNNKKRRNNTSGVTGVHLYKRTGMWTCNFIGKHLGTFGSFIEACEARIVAEVSSGITTKRHGL